MAQILFQDPALFLLLAVPLLYSVIAHEVAHGVVALGFGDDTARRAGRLTLNPIPHLELVGSALLLLVGFGWAKPVPVDFLRLRYGRLGVVCVSLAGVAVNIFLAALALYFLREGFADGKPQLAAILQITARINIMLGALNLIPIPPLDGSKVLLVLLPESLGRVYARLERFGFAILLILLLTGRLEPMLNTVQRWIIAAIT